MKTKESKKRSGKSSSPGADIAPRIWKTPWSTSVLGDTLPTAYEILVPEYSSRVYRHLSFRVQRWTDRYSTGMWNISEKRARNRLQNYLIPAEFDRIHGRLVEGKETSIRFGNRKEGRGYHGERGDFCLSSGCIDGKHLTLFYRSLELIGGLGYDLCIIAELAKLIGVHWSSVTFHAAHAHVFALRGNSNEKLYPQLRKILELDNG